MRRFVPGGATGGRRSAVGVDEFLRAYLTPRGRAAFYAALRNIYLDEPEGPEGFWTRLRELQSDSLFVWGRDDRLVPVGFARHVRDTLPGAAHVELGCGHVPQLEAPRETHAAIKQFLAASSGSSCQYLYTNNGSWLPGPGTDAGGRARRSSRPARPSRPPVPP